MILASRASPGPWLPHDPCEASRPGSRSPVSPPPGLHLPLLFALSSALQGSALLPTDFMQQARGVPLSRGWADLRTAVRRPWAEALGQSGVAEPDGPAALRCEPGEQDPAGAQDEPSGPPLRSALASTRPSSPGTALPCGVSPGAVSAVRNLARKFPDQSAREVRPDRAVGGRPGSRACTGSAGPRRSRCRPPPGCGARAPPSPGHSGPPSACAHSPSAPSGPPVRSRPWCTARVSAPRGGRRGRGLGMRTGGWECGGGAENGEGGARGGGGASRVGGARSGGTGGAASVRRRSPAALPPSDGRPPRAREGGFKGEGWAGGLGGGARGWQEGREPRLGDQKPGGRRAP